MCEEYKNTIYDYWETATHFENKISDNLDNMKKKMFVVYFSIKLN